MKITVDLRMKRFLTVAKIRGSLDATVIAESATRSFAIKLFVRLLERSGLTGTVFFDDERVEF